MIYCVSDIHGRIDLLEKLLEIVNFSNDDTLYVLGDCIDRGGGFAVLNKIIELQENGQAIFIQGNHELNFISNIAKLDNIVVKNIYHSGLLSESKKEKNTGFLGAFNNVIKQQYYHKKFGDSVNAAINLTAQEAYISCNEFLNIFDLDKRKKIVDFIKSAPLYCDVEVNNKNFRLLHAGCKADGTVSLNVRKEFYKNPSPLFIW